MRRVLLDTNVYIDWLNLGARESIVLGPGFVRHMSAIVLMELEVGATTPRARRAVSQIAEAFEKTRRLEPPSLGAWQRLGPTLRALRRKGREIRRASLVHDVLIALTARELGATLLTRDPTDHAAIQRLVDFSFIAV